MVFPPNISPPQFSIFNSQLSIFNPPYLPVACSVVFPPNISPFPILNFQFSIFNFPHSAPLPSTRASLLPDFTTTEAIFIQVLMGFTSLLSGFCTTFHTTLSTKIHTFHTTSKRFSKNFRFVSFLQSIVYIHIISYSHSLIFSYHIHRSAREICTFYCTIYFHFIFPLYSIFNFQTSIFISIYISTETTTLHKLQLYGESRTKPYQNT